MTNQQYTNMVLRPSTRVWWGGGMQRWTGRRHPISGLNEVMVYSIYADPGGGGTGLTEANIREVDTLLKGCAPFAINTLAFLPQDPYQEQLARQVQGSLMDAGVAVYLP